MRKLMCGISAMALALAAPAVAKIVTVGNLVIPISGCTQPYTVQAGDNLWMLSRLRLQNPERWHWLVQQNPLLQQPDRQYKKDGMTYVMIRPGEVLYCLQQAGINPDELNTNTNTNVERSVNLPQNNNWHGDKIAGFLENNWGWLLLLLGASFLVWLLRRELRQDPVQSRPPQVNGGISSVDAARERFADRGFRQHFTIMDMVGGYISGTMMVRYGGGTERPRTLDRQRAYRATVRHENGSIEDLYMLQACGNDLRYGGISRYLPGPNFCFEPDPVVEPTPEPEAALGTAAEVAPTPDEVDMIDGTDAIRIELQGAGGDLGKAMVRISGAPVEGMTVEMTPRSFTMRWVPDADSE